MKEKLRITSNLRNTELEMRTKIAGRWEVLTTDFFQVGADTFVTDPAYKNKTVLKIQFSDGQPTWDLEWDSSDPTVLIVDEKAGIDAYTANESKLAYELNLRKRQAVRNFIARHWQIENATDFNNGHAPTGHIIGRLELITQKQKFHHRSDRLKVAVFDMVDKMSFQDQYDLALYYAPWLAGKRRSEIIQGLVGLKGIGTKQADNGGALWQKQGLITKAEDFLRNYKDNPTVVMKIYVNKAVACGVISLGNGGLYLGGTTFIGKDADEAVVYFAKDLQSYTNVIQPEVNKKSKLPDDDMVDEKVDIRQVSRFEKNINYQAKRSSETDEYRRMRNELADMNWEVPTGTSMDKLKEMLDQAKAIAEGKTEVALTQTGQLEQKIDPMAHKDELSKLQKEAADLGVVGWATYKNIEKLRARIAEKRAQPA